MAMPVVAAERGLGGVTGDPRGQQGALQIRGKWKRRGRVVLASNHSHLGG